MAVEHRRILSDCRTLRTVVIVAALAASGILRPARLTAQPIVNQAAAAPRRVSVDVTVGTSAVRGGRERYVNDEGLAIELLVGLRRPSRQGLMYAAAAGVRVDAGQDCYVRLPVSPYAGCIPHAPTVGHLSFLAGSEVRRSGSSFRALLGPSIFSDGHHAGLGGRLHLSAAVGAPRVALTVGVNGNWLALSNGSSLRYYASAFGLRLQ
ncbi:MAG: hypothetical protein IPP90_04500 [Gemmatimonadaceae bacterium]|nr:hypothetical protein [Gemmatimonadaceae bacterium]